jgi:hypothetical protein
MEVPVGFKWFSSGLMDGSLAFGGEESAGASFLRRNGTIWTTDKDGPIMGLLAAEMTAREGRDPNEIYASATRDLGRSFYERIDAPASEEQKRAIENIEPQAFDVKELAGEPVEEKLNRAPGDNQAIGGIKVIAKWLVCRSALRHGERLQDLCGKLPERGTPEAHSDRCAGNCKPPFHAALTVLANVPNKAQWFAVRRVSSFRVFRSEWMER